MSSVNLSPVLEMVCFLNECDFDILICVSLVNFVSGSIETYFFTLSRFQWRIPPPTECLLRMPKDQVLSAGLVTPFSRP